MRAIQNLVIFRKEDRKVIAAFRLNTIITEMDCLVDPGHSYLVTTKKDIFKTESDGTVYVKNII